MVSINKTYAHILRWMLLIGSVVLFSAQAQTVREEAVLLDKPDGKPGSVKLAAGSPVKTLKRQGFWVEVDAAGKTGWLKVSQINFAGATGGATAIDTGRLGTGNIVATSAARGLSAKDLISGQPNFDEANKLDTLTAQPAVVQSFLVDIQGHTDRRHARERQCPYCCRSSMSNQLFDFPRIQDSIDAELR